MSTKLLHQVYAQEQAALAKLHNEGPELRQPRRKWAVDALKKTLTEQEYEAGCRAVRECINWFPGAAASLDRVDKAWSDAHFARQMDAGHALYGLRHAVGKRCKIKCAGDVVEWIVQLHTLQDIAQALGFWRNMGATRPPIPDVRPVRPMVRHVLFGMADYYVDCDRGAEKWGLRRGTNTSTL